MSTHGCISCSICHHGCPICHPKEHEDCRKKRIEKYWPSSDNYNDSREDIDAYYEKRGGGIW